MKILLTGTIHVGKTTLLETLKLRNFPNIAFVSEIAREILKEHPSLERQPILQDMLFAEQMRREQEAADSKEIVICDRGSVDIVAHCKMWGQPVRQAWIDWASTYNKVFLLDKDAVFFSPGKTAFEDRNRSWTDFRDSLDDNIRSALSSCNLSYEIMSGEINQKLRRMEAVIREHNSLIEGGRGLSNFGKR